MRARTVVVMAAILLAMLVPATIAQDEAIHGTWWIDGQEYACTCELVVKPTPEPIPTPMPEPSPTPEPSPEPGEWASACEFPFGGQIYGGLEADMYDNDHWQICPGVIGLVLWMNGPNHQYPFVAHEWLQTVSPDHYVVPMGSNPSMLTGKYNQSNIYHPEVADLIDGVLLGPEVLPGMPAENNVIVRDMATVFTTIYLECARAHAYGYDCIFAPSWQDMANHYPGTLTQGMVDAAIADLFHYLSPMGLDASVMGEVAAYLAPFVGQTLGEADMYAIMGPIPDVWLLQMAPASHACPDPVLGQELDPCFRDMVTVRYDWLVAANPDIRLHYQIAFPPIQSGESVEHWLDRAEWEFLSYREAVVFPESEFVWATPAEYTMGSQYYDDAVGRMDLIHAMLTPNE